MQDSQQMLKLATKFAPHPQALENSYQAGFRHAEVWLDPAVLAGWRQALQLLQAFPNGYALHFPNRLDLTPEALEQTVSLYRQLQSRCLVIHEPMCKKYREPLLRLEPDLQLAVENHKLSLSELTEWADRNDGLTLDIEHFWKYTLHDASLESLLDELRAFLGRFRAKVLHIHLPGYWPGFDEHRPMYCAREMIFPVLALLASVDFAGLVVSEVNLQYQTLADLKMDALLFEAWRRFQTESKATVP